MPKFVFHVGMGKTGSTTIQAALANNASALGEKGYLYLGQWLGFLRPEFDGFEGFQSFLKQSSTEFEYCSDLFIRGVQDLDRGGSFDSYIISNEQYLENVLKTEGFFRGISRNAELQIVIFVRPPATWLPSAYMQWGVIHKTNLGPLRPFAVKARELMRQYDHIRHWRELYGSAVAVLPFDDNSDVVQEIARYLNANLVWESGRYQARPSASEALLRGACNNTYKGVAFPEFYNEVYQRGIPDRTPRSLSGKFSYIFDVKDIDRIISENSETMSYIENEFGIDMRNKNIQESPEFNIDELTNEMLGTMIDIVFSQSNQINTLKDRIEELERQFGRR